MTPEGRENQVILAAMDLAERQILEGTASSQVISYFLKLGSQREREALEKEKLRNENKLLQAKVDALQQGIQMKELVEDAVNAFKSYSGHNDEDTME